jgi:hypothetical protein
VKYITKPALLCPSLPSSPPLTSHHNLPPSEANKGRRKIRGITCPPGRVPSAPPAKDCVLCTPAEANKGRRKLRGTPPRPRQEASPPAPLSGALTAPFLRRGTQDWFQGRIERAIGFIPSGIDLLDLWTWLCMLHETYHGVTCLLY